MRKPVRIVIIVAVIAVLAGGAYMKLRPAKAATATNLATATVQRGTLSATLAAAGNIQAHQTADLTFGQGGTVKAIHVKLGDRVKTGDVLGELDTADLALQLRSAQVSHKNAQDSLAQTQNPNTAQDIANARASLESAQASYDKVVAGASQADLASAQASLASAQASHDAAVKSAGATDSSLVSAASSFEKSRIALETAQSAYDKISWRGDAAATSQASALQTATIDYTTAKAAYESQTSTSKSDSSTKLASAAASLQSARANLAKLKNQVTAADLASAKASLTQAQNALDKLLAGPDANSLDMAQNGVESAQISMDQVKLKLRQAQVIAPFDGVVTAINAKIGQAASGTAFSIADLDHLEIVVNMAEVDVNRAKSGQQADVTLDALSDISLKGTVSQIAPAGVQSQGVVNYPVTIALDRAAEGVKTGMTANLSIIVDERPDVLMVPNRAVRTVARQKVVTVLFEGQQIQTPVTTGLSNDTMTEIATGLQEGDTVVLTTTSTSTSTRGFGGRDGPPGMPGM